MILCWRGGFSLSYNWNWFTAQRLRQLVNARPATNTIPSGRRLGETGERLEQAEVDREHGMIFNTTSPAAPLLSPKFPLSPLHFFPVPRSLHTIQFHLSKIFSTFPFPPLGLQILPPSGLTPRSPLAGAGRPCGRPSVYPGELWRRRGLPRGTPIPPPSLATPPFFSASPLI